jgi:hypothetical protein
VALFSLNGVADGPPPRRELAGAGVEEAFRMFGADTVWDRPPSRATERELEEYRPVPDRVRERDDTMEAEREERREEGGAYWLEGRGG